MKKDKCLYLSQEVMAHIQKQPNQTAYLEKLIAAAENVPPQVWVKKKQRKYELSEPICAVLEKHDNHSAFVENLVLSDMNGKCNT